MGDKNSYLGNKLKELRIAYKLSQSDIAEIIDKERSTIAKYENGVSEPPAKVLKEFANIYNVSVDELIDSGFNKKKVKVKSESDPEKENEEDNILSVPKKYRKLLMKMRRLNDDDFKKIKDEIFEMTGNKKKNEE